MGSCFLSDDHLRDHRYADHGTGCQRALCTGAGHGSERIFRVYGLFPAGLYLAAGAVDGVHLRSDQHLHHGDEDPQDHHQGDPAVFTECDRWRNRSVHCLSGISECRFYHV